MPTLKLVTKTSYCNSIIIAVNKFDFVKLLITETVVLKVYFEVLYWLLCLKRLSKTTKSVLVTNTNDQLKIVVFTLFAVGEKQFCGSVNVDMGIRRE